MPTFRPAPTYNSNFLTAPRAVRKGLGEVRGRRDHPPARTRRRRSGMEAAAPFHPGRTRRDLLDTD
eukprot:8131493-Alexandrium_andersonii.AAC.1